MMNVLAKMSANNSSSRPYLPIKQKYQAMFVGTDNGFDAQSIAKKTSYSLGDVATSNDTITMARVSGSEKENVLRASLLKEGDGAFVLRSDDTWRFAIVKEKVLGETPHIDFVLNEKGSLKRLSLGRWASRVRTLRGPSYTMMDQFISSLVLHLEIAEKEEGGDAYLKELVSLVPTMLQPSIEEEAPKQHAQSEAVASRPFPRRHRQSSSALFSSPTIRQEKNELFNEAHPIPRIGSQALTTNRRISCPDISSDHEVKHRGRKTRGRRRATIGPTSNSNRDGDNRQHTDSAKLKATFARASFRSVFEECMLKPL